MARRAPEAMTGGVLVAGVAGVLFFLDLGAYPLWDPDEARHAEVARELVEASGLRRLFLPTLEFRPYHEKPAGFYWLVALAYRTLGVTGGAARAVSATAALVTVLAVYAYAVRRMGREAAVAAALVLATSVGWVGLARVSTLDMTLTAFVATGVLAGLAWLERPSRRGALLPYVLAACGVLVKGPIALALVGGPLALAALLRRPRPTLAEVRPVRGAVVLAGIVGLLYVPVALLDATYLRGFVWTHVRRLGAGAPHAAPAWYYLVWVPVLLLPWTPFAPAALVRAARDPTRRPLLAWAVYVPAVLTLARGKLATYALSVLPPLALLVGPELARLVRVGAQSEDERALRWSGWTVAALLTGVAVAVPPLTMRFPTPWLGTIVVAGAAAAWAAAVTRALLEDRPTLVPAILLGATLTLYPLAIHLVVPPVSRVRSDHDFAATIAAADPAAPVIAFAARAPSLVFYLRRPVVNTDDPQVVRDLFDGTGAVFLVAGRRHFDRLQRVLGARAHVWAENPRRRLYGNFTPRDPCLGADRMRE